MKRTRQPEPTEPLVMSCAHHRSAAKSNVRNVAVMHGVAGWRARLGPAFARPIGRIYFQPPSAFQHSQSELLANFATAPQEALPRSGMPLRVFDLEGYGRTLIERGLRDAAGFHVRSKSKLQATCSSPAPANPADAADVDPERLHGSRHTGNEIERRYRSD